MQKKYWQTMALMGIGASLISGCGGGGGSNNSSSSSEPTVSVSGSAVKGPMNDAEIRVTRLDGSLLTTESVDGGTFKLDKVPSDHDAVIFQTSGGNYVDEATGKTVHPGDGEGLRAIVTRGELQDMDKDGMRLVLTPETTIIAKLAEYKIDNGQDPEEAIAEATGMVFDQLETGTNPAAMLGTPETPTRFGNLADPQQPQESFALNRASGFAFYTHSMRLDPDQSFELMFHTAHDLYDGTLDGRAGDEPIRMTNRDGDELDLSKHGARMEFAQGRSRSMDRQLNQLVQGTLPAEQEQMLETMGMDLTTYKEMAKQHEQGIETTEGNLAADNLPEFQHLPVMADEDGDPNNGEGHYTFMAKPDVDVPIQAPGMSWVTPMYRYNGQALPPVVKAQRGEELFMRLVNELDEDTTIHWHGFEVPGPEDGGPDFPVAPNDTKLYHFTLEQPAAPLWFHPHPDMATGNQVYRGLGGLLLLEDDISRRLEADNKLPSGDYDIPMAIQDRRFLAAEGGKRELAYLDRPMDTDGMLGDSILVNGVQLPRLAVEGRQYRLRLYNLSNARTYDLALHDGKKFYVVATDGGLLPQPVEVDHVTLGAAERVEVVIDFGDYNAGDRVMLVSRVFMGGAMAGMMDMGGMGGNTGGMPGMGDTPATGDMPDMGGVPDMDGGADMVGDPDGNDMPGMGDMPDTGDIPDMGDDRNGPMTALDSNGSNPGDMPGDMDPGDGTPPGDMPGDMPGMGGDLMNGSGFDVMRFDVIGEADDPVDLYDSLPEEAEIHTRWKTEDVSEVRPFLMAMDMMTGTFTINGKFFDLERVDELVKPGATEVWELRNFSPMAHPFHAHAIQWQILDRNGIPATGIDLGWKDTVLVQPGETVRFIGRFEPVNTGKYMYHCHILEHEDAGMMGIFEVQAP